MNPIRKYLEDFAKWLWCWRYGHSMAVKGVVRTHEYESTTEWWIRTKCVHCGLVRHRPIPNTEANTCIEDFGWAED